MPFYKERQFVGLDCGQEMITKQSMTAECDINNILRQYERTGVVSHTAPVQGAFIDLPDGFDFQQAMTTVMEAQLAFEQLPARVREEFGNDAARFFAAVHDDTQTERLRELGLLSPSAAAEGGAAPADSPGDP